MAEMLRLSPPQPLLFHDYGFGVDEDGVEVDGVEPGGVVGVLGAIVLFMDLA